MFLSVVPFLYSKRTAAARSLVSRLALSKSERFVATSSTLAVELPLPAGRLTRLDLQDRVYSCQAGPVEAAPRQ